jgi:lambda family phage minor tail protein L
MPVQVADLLKTDQESGIVELFDVDLTMFGGDIYHLTPYNIPAGFTTFGGVNYFPFPIQLKDAAVSSTGTMPQPTLYVGRVENKLLLTAMVTFGRDLCGMIVTRRKTHEKYLATGSSPDGTKHTYIERYTAIQMVSNTKTQIAWKLAWPIDVPTALVPGMQYLKDQTTNNVYAPGLSRIIGQ